MRHTSRSNNSLHRPDQNQSHRPHGPIHHSACGTALRSLKRGFLLRRLSDASRRIRGHAFQAAGIRNPLQTRTLLHAGSMSQTGHEEPLGLFGAGSNSDELDAHPALTEHDCSRNNTGDDGGADHESVDERLAHEMRDHDRMRARPAPGRKRRRANNPARGGCLSNSSSCGVRARREVRS